MSDQPDQSPASDAASASSSDRLQTDHALPPAGMLSHATASSSSYDASAAPHAPPPFAWLSPPQARLAPPPHDPLALAALAATGRPLWDAYVQREAAAIAAARGAATPPQRMTPEEREAARDLALRTMLVVASVGAEAGTHDGRLDAPVEAAVAALLVAQEMVDEAPPPPSPVQSIAFVKKLHLQLEQLHLQQLQQLQPPTASLALHLSQPGARQAAARLALIFAISGFANKKPTRANIGWLGARLNASRMKHGEQWRDVSVTEEAAALRVAVETLTGDQARLPSHPDAEAFASVLLLAMKTAGQAALEQASQEEEEDEEEPQRAPVRRGRGGARGRGSRGSASQPRGKRPAAAAAAAPKADADATQPKQRSPRGRGGRGSRGGGTGGRCEQAGPESSSGLV